MKAKLVTFFLHVALGLALLLTVLSVMAQPVPPAFKQAQEREALLRLYGQTALCMHRATLAVMRHGGGKAFAYGFVGQSCGAPIMEFLVKISGWSALDAARLVDGMAVREVDQTYQSL
jgi:hypothetical protein